MYRLVAALLAGAVPKALLCCTALPACAAVKCAIVENIVERERVHRACTMPTNAKLAPLLVMQYGCKKKLVVNTREPAQHAGVGLWQGKAWSRP